jgi:hypothetical protein
MVKAQMVPLEVAEVLVGQMALLQLDKQVVYTVVVARVELVLEVAALWHILIIIQ